MLEVCFSDYELDNKLAKAHLEFESIGKPSSKVKMQQFTARRLKKVFDSEKEKNNEQNSL